MKKIYVSHPFTGDEERNRVEARTIAAELAGQFPDVLFINPLDVFQHLAVEKWPYEEVMEQCLELLLMCDGVILTGEWEYSQGCQMEYRTARSADMDIFTGQTEIRAWKKENHLKDLRKAREYIDIMIEELEGKDES